MKDTGISVVMPVYNAGNYLAPAIDSILKQTHQKLELLIVNDNSTDGSLNQISAQLADPRVTLLHSPGRGIIEALNFGISAARYELIARMDGDDLASPDRLSVQLNYLIDNPEVDIVGAAIELFKDNSDIGQGYSLYQQWINNLCDHRDIAEQFFVESAIPHPTAMFSKTTFSSLDGYQDHGWPEDYDLWCRAFLAGMRFGKPKSHPLLYWRDHDERASRQDKRYAKQGFLQCKAHYLAGFLKQQYSIETCSIWGAGPTGLKLHDYLESNGMQVTHFYDINPKLKDRTKRDKPVHVVQVSKRLDKTNAASHICIVAVSARGAREELQALFMANGWQSNTDYIFAS